MASEDTCTWCDRQTPEAVDIDHTTHLRMSLFKTSTYFFRSSISAGSFALRIENGGGGAPSWTYRPPGCRSPPASKISNKASEYLRNSSVDPA